MEDEPLMFDRFVVEADKRVVGIAVRVAGGFKFFASDEDYFEVEARVFPRARAMAQRIAVIARRRRESTEPRHARHSLQCANRSPMRPPTGRSLPRA